MPVQTGKDKDGCYARWGGDGHKYRYKCGDDEARRRARHKAHIQGAAIKARGGG